MRAFKSVLLAASMMTTALPAGADDALSPLWRYLTLSNQCFPTRHHGFAEGADSLKIPDAILSLGSSDHVGHPYSYASGQKVADAGYTTSIVVSDPEVGIVGGVGRAYEYGFSIVRDNRVLGPTQRRQAAKVKLKPARLDRRAISTRRGLHLGSTLQDVQRVFANRTGNWRNDYSAACAQGSGIKPVRLSVWTWGGHSPGCSRSMEITVDEKTNAVIEIAEYGGC